MTTTFDDNENLFEELKILSQEDKIKTSEKIFDSHACECECIHTFQIDKDDYICTQCGFIKEREADLDKEWRFFSSEASFKRDPSRCSIRKNQDSCSIKKECEKLTGFPGKIINDANDIYKKTTEGSIYRGKKRISIIFACLYYSLQNNDSPISPQKLLELFDIDKSSALRGIKWLKTNLSFKSITIKQGSENSDIINLIRELMSDLNATEIQIGEVIEIYRLLCGRSSLLNRSRPLSFALGCIRYYLTKKNKHLELGDLSKTLKLSNLTLKRITSEIELVLH